MSNCNKAKPNNENMTDKELLKLKNLELFKQALCEGVSRKIDKVIEEGADIEMPSDTKKRMDEFFATLLKSLD